MKSVDGGSHLLEWEVTDQHGGGGGKLEGPRRIKVWDLSENTSLAPVGPDGYI